MRLAPIVIASLLIGGSSAGTILVARQNPEFRSTLWSMYDRIVLAIESLGEVPTTHEYAALNCAVEGLHLDGAVELSNGRLVVAETTRPPFENSEREWVKGLFQQTVGSECGSGAVNELYRRNQKRYPLRVDRFESEVVLAPSGDCPFGEKGLNCPLQLSRVGFNYDGNKAALYFSRGVRLTGYAFLARDDDQWSVSRIKYLTRPKVLSNNPPKLAKRSVMALAVARSTPGHPAALRKR